ncbi:hypothetical protein LNI95_12075 [Tenacibaculum dicentrarchi]|nr:hypothetical protein [Tenacibaculum dicentrarchi]MCD8438400.1 hypothetical protein [Tenacibaculum dicentrarchi]
MTKKEILKKCDLYINLFKRLDNVKRNNILEFIDFADLHLPEHSNLAFEINQLNSDEFSEHAKRIKDFIETNGSKSIIEKNNLLSEKNDVELIGIIFSICVIVFGIGFYFGTEKTNINFIKTENKLLKLKDSISSIKSIDSTNRITNRKKKITKSKKDNN